MQRTTLLLCLSFLCGSSWADYSNSEPPIKLKIQEPKANKSGLLLESGWNLGFRLSTSDWVGYLDTKRRFTSGHFEALILADPDDCLDLSDIAPGAEPFDNTCSGPDETYVKFRSDRNDERELVDNMDECRPDQAVTLQDTPLAEVLSGVGFANSNKVYLTGPFGDSAAGVRTGAQTPDCYGYGVDDDLPGLVVMIDIGGARFYDLDFNPIPSPDSGEARRIKNSAGLLSNVGSEFSDKNGVTSIVAHMRVERGVLEPIAVYDVDLDNPNYDAARRVDGGPIEFLNLGYAPNNLSDAFNLVKTTMLDEYIVSVRAVLVAGTAPAVIEDMDGNGKFTAADVELMGYTLLSNQAHKKLRLMQRETIEVTSDLDCPAAEAVFEADLDGAAPKNWPQCGSQEGDGTSRSIRRRFL